MEPFDAKGVIAWSLTDCMDGDLMFIMFDDGLTLSILVLTWFVVSCVLAFPFSSTL